MKRAALHNNIETVRNNNVETLVAVPRERMLCEIRMQGAQKSNEGNGKNAFLDATKIRNNSIETRAVFPMERRMHQNSSGIKH